MIIEELFCEVDDFCKLFFPQWEATLISEGVQEKTWSCRMSPSEIMTIMIMFHQSHYRNFKHFYLIHIGKHHQHEFPSLLSYSRFVEQKKRIAMPLFFFMLSLSKNENGIYFIDSTTIKACHIKREKQHKVFDGLAEKSKSTLGWFFGFKLHILVNSSGELMAVKLTRAKVDDREVVEDLSDGLMGKLIGDKGYISKTLKEKLFQNGIELITKVRKNMKKISLDGFDKLLLRKRAVVETVIDQLKNISQIEHTRHRSIENFLLNIVSGLTAYQLSPKKPSINVEYTGVTVV